MISKALPHRAALAVSGTLLSVLLAACSPAVKATYDSAFQPQPGSKVRLAAVEEAAGAADSGVDVAAELRQQLEMQLGQAGLLASSRSSGPQIDLSVTIEGYSAGSAIGGRYLRLLEATKLLIECELSDRGRDVGTITIDREVTGGLRTAEARQDVFADAAGDIVQELAGKLK